MFVGEKQLKISIFREFPRGWGNRSFLSMFGGQIDFSETFFFLWFYFAHPTKAIFHKLSDRPVKFLS